MGGAKFYNDALVKLDAKALGSDTMKKSLETFRKIKGYTDAASAGRDWNLTTALVMQGKAGFQFMGDWAKGEFLAAGKVPGKDFLCAAAPAPPTPTPSTSIPSPCSSSSRLMRKSPGRSGGCDHGPRVPGSV